MAELAWRVLPRAPLSLVSRAGEHAVRPLVAQLLFNRGLDDPAEMRAFLDGGPEPGDAMLLRGMGSAVAVLRRAIAARERVAVYGDYDADGVTATAVLVETLRALGGSAEAYIPQRATEGYGLNRAAVGRLRDDGYKVLLTADCGIGGQAEIAYATELGLAVVVTDHHEVHGPLPAAVAVVNPKQVGDLYGFTGLAGVGVAYKLAAALFAGGGPAARWAEVEPSLLELVAIGTVADVVPLIGENRTLVRRGLAQLRVSKRPGLQALADVAGVELSAVDEGQIAFTLAPRLNAAGRMADARLAYQLLTTDDFDEAEQLARKLERHNQERQRLTEQGVLLAREQLALLGDAPVLLLVHEDFAAGVVGLVASKMVEETGRPTIVLQRGAQQCRGSARSVEGFDIGAAMADCAELLVRFGGHPLAAGLAVTTEHLEELRERLQAVAGERLEGRDLRPELPIDAELPLSQLNWDLQDELSGLAPYGLGNPEPLFSCSATVREKRTMGRAGNHLSLWLQDEATSLRAVGFGMGALARELPARLSVAYSLRTNNWNGQNRLELRLRDLRPA